MSEDNDSNSNPNRICNDSNQITKICKYLITIKISNSKNLNRVNDSEQIYECSFQEKTIEQIT